MMAVVSIPVTLDASGDAVVTHAGEGQDVANITCSLATVLPLAAKIDQNGFVLDYTLNGASWHTVFPNFVPVGSVLTVTISGPPAAAGVTGTVTLEVSP